MRPTRWVHLAIGVGHLFSEQSVQRTARRIGPFERDDVGHAAVAALVNFCNNCLYIVHSCRSRLRNEKLGYK